MEPKPATELEGLSDRMFSHYRVLELIGRGGMGVVYRALDTQLERPVALKFMDPARATVPGQKRRFQQEARSASAITHPNVAHVYDIGEVDGLWFIVMEYVEGEPLNRKLHGKPLDESEVVELGVQIVDAVAAAHAKGIVHRDLKPSNIIVTPAGFVKVLDFGLAKAMKTGHSDEDLTATKPGMIIGTVDYMSPEQALGEPVDPRSDLFSLGTVLYEMATGTVPFRGGTATETLSRIIAKQPEAVARYNYSVTGELERIIRKCLEKDSASRYQTAAELGVDLRNLRRDRTSGVLSTARQQDQARVPRRTIVWIGSAMTAGAVGALGLWGLREKLSAPSLNTLAVFPFVNLTGDPQFEYLADGITENLINSLSNLESISVRSRSAVFRYKEAQSKKDLDLTDIAGKLKAAAVVTGRLSLQEGDLVLSAELMDVAQEKQLWGEQYRQNANSIFQAQDAIAREIAANLHIAVSAKDRLKLSRSERVDSAAYHSYLRGRFFWNKRTADDLKKAIDYFNQAIEKDQNFALAWAGVADCYMLLGTGAMHPREAFPRARNAAKKAIELDPEAGEPYATLGYVGLHYDWNWVETEASLKRAVRLSPRYPMAHSVYGRYLSALGRFDEAIAEMKRALELEPLALGVSTGLGLSYYFARKYEAATEQHKKTLEIEPRFALAWFNLGGVYTQRGMYQDAIESFQKGLEISSKDAGALAELGHTYARAGRLEDARSCLRRITEVSKQRYVAPYFPALVHVALGDKESTFRSLEDAWNDRSSSLVFLKVDPRWDAVRSDARFTDLLRRLALS